MSVLKVPFKRNDGCDILLLLQSLLRTAYYTVNKYAMLDFYYACNKAALLYSLK
jgi:hypothetical protein